MRFLFSTRLDIPPVALQNVLASFESWRARATALSLTEYEGIRAS
jgi:hypothetical protein